MVACRACGTESPDGFRFCPACGTALPDAVAAARAPHVVEERRVVTALFCDLVEFTATSEQADPEDVHRFLAAYEAMARAEIERHGGTVEKFIGDAVVGVFGIPTAHEDDAMRAIRAGLAITAGSADLRGPDGSPIRLRVGINTGEVLAQLNVDPASGERFFIGDAVNTAARIQSVAPEMSVAVGESTYDATRRMVAYEPLPAVSVKGKTRPLVLYRAMGVREAREPAEGDDDSTPYVGRDDELRRLVALFEATGQGTGAALVTVIGEAGMGKSRLVAEFGRHVRAHDPKTAWLRGRCLPYGDGITFWALGEIVKGRAGILESDPPEMVRQKLAASIGQGEDAAWVLERMLPLVGLEGTPAERDELFAAWLRFLESMAIDGPAVLLFEDLHWADPALVSFLEYACAEAHRALFLVATARPDLLERHPDFGTTGNAERLQLAALQPEDSMELAAAILGGTPAADLAAAIRDRSEGVPLYVDEYARLLRDRDLITARNGSVTVRPGAELPVPGSIHALLAARLDTLAPDQRAVLADAAVVGKTFWSGAVAVLGQRQAETPRGALAVLERRGFVRHIQPSSMADEDEYTFSHVLVRDVAYGQLPRAERAARHSGVAMWLEQKLGSRVEDAADVLADHWHTALELATASGRTEEAAEFAPHTLRFLILAADRALNLDTAAAVKHLERAERLAPPGHASRAEVLSRLGSAQGDVGRFREAIDNLEEAASDFARRGAWREQARAQLSLAGAIIGIGDSSGRYERLRADTLQLLETHEPTPELIRALIETAADAQDAGDPRGAIDILDRCATLADELGMPFPSRALGFRGNARAELGDPGGFDDMREAVAAATSAGLGRDMVLAKINMAGYLAEYHGPAAALQTTRDAIADAQRHGLLALSRAMSFMLFEALFESGDYDAALAGCEAGLAESSIEQAPSTLPLRIRAIRGATSGIAEELPGIEAVARNITIPAWRVSRLAALAFLHHLVGNAQRSHELMRELAELGIGGGDGSKPYLPLVRIASQAGDVDLAKRLAALMTTAQYAGPRARGLAARAVIAEASHRTDEAVALYRDALVLWEDLGVPYEAFHVQLGMARSLVALGREGEARGHADAARHIAESLAASPLVAEVDRLGAIPRG